MKLYYDEKGKFYTDYVTKVSQPVIINTLHHTIRGNIHLRTDERLSDGLNSSQNFLAVTGVVVSSHSGEELYRANFFSINLEHVVWIMPSEEVTYGPGIKGES